MNAYTYYKKFRNERIIRQNVHDSRTLLKTLVCPKKFGQNQNITVQTGSINSLPDV
jgi:hypothetical protein